MKSLFRMFMLAAFVGILIPGPALHAQTSEPAPADTQKNMVEQPETDSFDRLQDDMEPNGISSGPATGCPFDEEALGQPLLG